MTRNMQWYTGSIIYICIRVVGAPRQEGIHMEGLLHSIRLKELCTYLLKNPSGLLARLLIDILRRVHILS